MFTLVVSTANAYPFGFYATLVVSTANVYPCGVYD